MLGHGGVAEFAVSDYSSEIIILPAGIASGLAFGSPVLYRLLLPTGIASGLAFGADRAVHIDESVLVELIESFSFELVGTQRARIAWTGDPAKESFVIANGKVLAGPLTHATADKEAEVTVPDPCRIEIHEGEAPSIVGAVLERYPVIHWARVAAAVSYRVYRKRNAGASEERASLVLPATGQQLFEARLPQSQRQDNGVWNQYRVAAIGAKGAESTGETFPHWVPGLPPLPTAIAVSGPYDNLVVELTA